jgi:ParB-like chromosome segregation protein Spo0J
MKPHQKAVKQRTFKTHTNTSLRLCGPFAKYPRIEIASIDTLRSSPHNARKHSKHQIRQLANSIVRFGWSAPIVLDEHGTILCGHARHEAAKLIRLREVPVIVMVGLKEGEKRAFALADNKVAANADWDFKVLAAEFGELGKLLPELSLNLEITGFESAEVRSLLGDRWDPKADLIDDVPKPTRKPITRQKIDAVSRIGDLWELRPHKILCDHALSADYVPRLLSSVTAAIIVMGPPYRLPIKRFPRRGPCSDEMTAAQFTRLLRDSLAHTKHSLCDAMHFVVVDWPRREEIGAGSVLAPPCADAAVRWWQARTQRSAILARTGQTFDEVAAVRRKSGDAS